MVSPDFTAPFFGGDSVCLGDRAWRSPPYYPGWYRWTTKGRKAFRYGQELDPFCPECQEALLDATLPVYTGYLLGDRLVENNNLGLRQLSQLRKVWYIPPDPLKFQQFNVVEWPSGDLIFRDEALGIEQDFSVRNIFEAHRGAEEISSTPGVSPILKRLFLWENEIREAEERARREAEEAEARRLAALAAEERRKAAEEAERRALGEFATAVPLILSGFGATLLRLRDTGRGEAEVAFSYLGRRMACIVRKDTMQIIDAGICLEDHRTGEKHDNRLTLRALIPVVREAIETDKLVIWRHA